MKTSDFFETIVQGPILLLNKHMSGCLTISPNKSILVNAKITEKPQQEVMLFKNVVHFGNILMSCGTIQMTPDTTVCLPIRYLIYGKNTTLLQEQKWHYVCLDYNCSYGLHYDFEDNKTNNTELKCDENTVLKVSTHESWRQNCNTSDTTVILRLCFYSKEKINIDKLQDLYNKANSILSAYSGKPMSPYNITAMNSKTPKDQYVNIVLNTIQHSNIVDQDVKLLTVKVNLLGMLKNTLTKSILPAHLWRSYLEQSDTAMHQIMYIEQRIETLCRCLECLCDLYMIKNSKTEQTKKDQREKQFNALVDLVEANTKINNDTKRWLKGRRKEFLNRSPLAQKIECLAKNSSEVNINSDEDDTPLYLSLRISGIAEEIGSIRNQLAHTGTISQESLNLILNSNINHIDSTIEPFVRKEVVRYLETEYEA